MGGEGPPDPGPLTPGTAWEASPDTRDGARRGRARPGAPDPRDGPGSLPRTPGRGPIGAGPDPGPLTTPRDASPDTRAGAHRGRARPGAPDPRDGLGGLPGSAGHPGRGP
ncbi:hypothetical protein NDU88_000814 [Pleurodeles waltl]|uniref:Uncharacterized protein n=1 Tax=Pleurodeles waltl TaxID=8319 RepID=A0AAV7THC6_PLEWA|nr:hypothetical protein NDU88_000814 [Pleurodeles waltl]